ncbi:MAG: hypothetical protein A2017_20520 [Lentisphaerae bacterium GWF2_44_16]|nr:MAG: hypothetical protein A2017_20520 [Lentisphaerae bacterium GWF2_44_16]
MNLSVKHTKSQIIYITIEKQIYEGKLKAGEKLQSIRNIAKHFSSSISVVQSALRNLENDNLIEAKPGSGTFVKTLKFQNASKNVFLSLPSEGHIYEDFSQMLRNKLFERGFVPITVDYNQMISMSPASAFQKNIDEILRSGIRAVIVYGGSYWRHPFLEKHKGVRSVFLCHVDYSGKIPDRAVLLDHERAIYLTTAHLAANGRKKIILCTFKPNPRSLSPETFTRHHSTQFISGYDRALKEYNIASYRKIFYHTGIDINEDLLKKLMHAAEPPDAIVCDSDYHAMLFINSAIKLGIKIPEDISITGNYNTPWSELSPIKITSTCFDWEDLALNAVKLAIDDNSEHKIIYLKPILKIRKSSTV